MNLGKKLINIRKKEKITQEKFDEKTKQYYIDEKFYAGKTLSEIFGNLEIIKKVMINEYHTKCR